MDTHVKRETKSTTESESESDIDETPPKKLCRQPKSNRPSWTYKFDDSWLNMPIFMGWLEQVPDADQAHSSTESLKSSFCKLCKIRILSHESVLRNHAEKAKHKENAARAAEPVKVTPPLPMSTLTKNVRRAELKLCAFIALHNLPLSLIDSLTPLLKDILPDSDIAQHVTLNKTRCTAVLTKILGHYFLEKVYLQLRAPGCFFSLMSSKLTDDSTKKQCVFSVRYYDTVKCSIVTNFFDIVEVEEGKAKELFTALKKSLLDKNIPLSNLVAISPDSAKITTGNHSVFTLLKNEFPNMLCVKCSCHMTNSAISHACSKLPNSLEDLVKDIVVHLSRSSSRNEQLRKFQLFFVTDAYKRCNLTMQCWLSSPYFVDKVVGQFQPLKAYITEVDFEETSNKYRMLSTMEDKFTQIYLEFLSYVHSLMTGFDTLFRSKKPLLHKVKAETAKLLKTICSNYIEIEIIKINDIFELDHKESDYFVEMDNICIGVAAQQSFQSVKGIPGLQRSCNKFLSKILKFYVDLVTRIKNSVVFDDPIYDLLLLIEPSSAQSFQETSLKGIIDRYPVLNDFIQMQKLDNEWRHHALLDIKDLNLEAITDSEEYWKKIFQMKDVSGMELFPNLKKVVRFLFLLAHSHACENSIYGDLVKIRSNKQNVLDISTLKALLASKEGIEQSGCCVEFEPDSDMINSNSWHEFHE